MSYYNFQQFKEQCFIPGELKSSGSFPQPCPSSGLLPWGSSLDPKLCLLPKSRQGCVETQVMEGHHQHLQHLHHQSSSSSSSACSTSRCLDVGGEVGVARRCGQVCGPATPTRCAQVCALATPARCAQVCSPVVPVRCAQVCAPATPTRCVQVCSPAVTPRCAQVCSPVVVPTRCAQVCVPATPPRCAQVCSPTLPACREGSGPFSYQWSNSYQYSCGQ